MLHGEPILLQNPATMDTNAAVELLAEGFAIAEGYPNAHSIPWRTKNPGDLCIGDLGSGVLNHKTIFATHAQGWEALRLQARKILTGDHSIYRPTMTLLEVAIRYTGQDHAADWAHIVSVHCGIPTNAAIGTLLKL